MHDRWRWTDAVRALLAVAATAATLAGAAPAAAIDTWPGGVVTFHVTAPGLRWPTLQAAREWNRSGARVRLVERPAATARLSVRPMRRSPCFGPVGLAPVGAYPSAYDGAMLLQPGCSRFELVAIAVHEFGHVLGLDHDDRRCSVMNSSTDLRCTDVVYPWEYRCHPLEAVDIRRAVALYGGRAPRRPTRALCLSAPTPTRALRVQAAVNPAGAIAATRITWRNPSSRALRTISINRRRGQDCPSYPSSGIRLIPGRAATHPGEAVALLEARDRRGQAQEAFDVGDVVPGRWCYAVWAIGPGGRFARAGTVRVQHPGLDRSAARIGLTATPLPAPGIRVRLAWTTPAAPGFEGLSVERATGPCPRDPTAFLGRSIGQPAPTPGPAALDDTDLVTPAGAWCYALAFRATGGLAEQRILLEVAVPEPPNVAPVAAIDNLPASGSLTDGTNTIDVDAGLSTDVDGSIVAWAWDLGDGTTASSSGVRHTYALPGTYTVTLTVTDDRGATGTAVGAIVITA